MTDKATILAMLDKWTRQRSGMEFANYGDISAYRSEQRSITRDLHDYRQLARAVELSGITGDQIKEAFRAYSGRLRLTESDGKLTLDYCTGQYFPTEYRKAACAVLASALWDYARKEIVKDRAGDAPNTMYRDTSPGDALRRYFRRQFGRGIASRWFN